MQGVRKGALFLCLADSVFVPILKLTVAIFATVQYNIPCASIRGGLSEWSIVRHSKCRVPKGTQGSNPWPSARRNALSFTQNEGAFFYPVLWIHIVFLNDIFLFLTISHAKGA